MIVRRSEWQYKGECLQGRLSFVLQLLQETEEVMRSELMSEETNYEALVSRLLRGGIEEKSQSLRRLVFLFENARSKIYLYERRITENLELCLLIEEKEISLLALNLLEKIVAGTAPDSEIIAIIRRRLLTKVVVNLGSVEINIRKYAHKCILEFLRKVADFVPVTLVYLKAAILQAENTHLKLKTINSFHSLLMVEGKLFKHDSDGALALLNELIVAAYQQSHFEISRAAFLCLVQILRLPNSQQNVRLLSKQTHNKLEQLQKNNAELANLLKGSEVNTQSQESDMPSPKFISINTSQVDTDEHPKEADIPAFRLPPQPITPTAQTPLKRIPSPLEPPPEQSLSLVDDVTHAQEFLRKFERAEGLQLEELTNFAPLLENYLLADSIRLFSLSKKIVETILESEGGQKKQYYVIVVPCVVNGIGSRRFIVRKHLDKLVRQYTHRHTEVWIDSFIDRLSASSNDKVKESLLDLLTHAYKSSPEFYYPSQKVFQALDQEVNDKTSHLKWKAVETIVMVVERQAKTEKQVEQMLSVLSQQTYQKVSRKMSKTTAAGFGVSDVQPSLANIPVVLQAVSPSNNSRRLRRPNRILTEEPAVSSHDILLENEANRSPHSNFQLSYLPPSISHQNHSPTNPTQKQSLPRRVRKSQIDRDVLVRRPKDQHSRQEKTSLEKLPQLKKVPASGKAAELFSGVEKLHSQIGSRAEQADSPVKKFVSERGIGSSVQVGHNPNQPNLRPLENPRQELETALSTIKQANWSYQLECILVFRSAIQFHRDIFIDDNYINGIVNELLNCLLSTRTSLTRATLTCLCELMRSFHKRMYPHTDPILSAIIRRSLSCSDFIQEQIKRCIQICVDELSLPRIIATFTTFRDTKSLQIKLCLLLLLESMVRHEKTYKKETEWLWNTALEMCDDQGQNVRSQARRIVKAMIQIYKDWREAVQVVRRKNLQRLEKVLKSMKTQSQEQEAEGPNQQRFAISKTITAKYFAQQFGRIERTDKLFTEKRNWRDKINLLNETFQCAFEHIGEFTANQSVCRKYFQLLIEHFDERCLGLTLNAAPLVIRCMETGLTSQIDDLLGDLLDRVINIAATHQKRTQVTFVLGALFQRIQQSFQLKKVARELSKIVSYGITAGQQTKSSLYAFERLLILLQGAPEGPSATASLHVSANSLTSQIQQDPVLVILSKLTAKLSTGGPEIHPRIKQLVDTVKKRYGIDLGKKISFQ